ncbi:hypothetical protein [Halocella sp. SP3-1]|uniref:hypothetical protein n=1 Tax=Halocella sp. SP3-1 TaxID=2382161 RepID=UPI000F764EF5|nr:hypothetical protein [Halocella sp. SP3-1]AZO96152.1 hypothetical protein D7D81_17000 [Halocella sp. SP3-1]
MLVKYKDYKDWLDIFEEKCAMDMGIRYSHSPKSITNNFHSTTENQVLKREEDREEYKEKQAYVDLVNSILDKLTVPEKFIIDRKFNLINDDFYKRFQPGKVPDAEIYTCEDFPYERAYYIKIKLKAYNKIYSLLKILPTQ